MEASYLVVLLRPLHENFGKRLIKTPKLYLTDTGLLCWLLHHLHVHRVLLADEIHHEELRWHGHGCTYTAGLHHALHRVV